MSQDADYPGQVPVAEAAATAFCMRSLLAQSGVARRQASGRRRPHIRFRMRGRLPVVKLAEPRSPYYLSAHIARCRVRIHAGSR